MTSVLDPLVSDLCEISTAEELANWKRSHQITSELIREIGSAVVRIMDASEFAVASRLADWILLLAEDLAEPAITALALNLKGITLFRLNECRKALPYLDEAIRISEQSGDELYAAKVRKNRLTVRCYLAMYDEALRDGEVAVETFGKLGDKNFQAATCINLSDVLFRLDRFQESLAILERAEDLLREIDNSRYRVGLYFNRAVSLTSLNRSDEARKYFELSRQLAEETGFTYLAALSNYNLGYLHYVQGEYTKALDALDATRSTLRTEQWHVSLCDLTQSEIYLEMNMHRDAIRLAEAAYQGFGRIEQAFEMAKALTVMGIAQTHLQQFRRAAELFEQARKMFQQQGNHIRAAAIDLYEGIISLQLGRHAEARTLAQAAYQVFAQEDVKPRAAFAQVVCARASLKLRDYETAAADAEMAARLYQQSPTPWIGHQLHSVLGEIHAAKNALVAACEEFSKAIDESERVRANIVLEELRLNYLKDKIPIHESLVDAQLRLGDTSKLREAFETVERAKSRTLVDLLAGSVDSLRHITWPAVEDIQEVLPPDTALIEYFINGDNVLAFLLSRESFQVCQNICLRDALRNAFELMRFQLSRGPLGTPDSERGEMRLSNIRSHLADLYRLLVRPIEGFLAGRSSVVFVPFDFLHYLPFHALFDGSEYLVDRLMISYAPSASIYRLFRRTQREASGPALLIGVPDPGTPFISDEIQSIRAILPDTRTFVGDDATQDRLAREMADARLIHIASHAYFRPDNPMFSAIQLHGTSLNFFDIYNLRTSANLITLSGCSTGLSSVVAGDELLGLIRGFLYAGATSVVLSLWDVNDRATADFMKHFYSYLAEGQSKSRSLQLAMLRVREMHPHPYYWAPFLLVGQS